MDKQKIEKYLAVIGRACDLIRQEMQEDVSQTFEQLAKNEPVASPPKAVVQPSKPTDERTKHIESLMAIDCWPKAVNRDQSQPPSEADMINRANAVLDMTLGTSIEGATFLDYGCGDGYIASQIATRGPISITGYDINPSDHWSKLTTDKVKYTSDTNSLKPKGYDLVFLYDVLDHAGDADGVMKHVKYLAVPKSIVYVRCHPWTSRHASHLPKVGLNKAFIHLFLTYEELVGLGHTPLFTRAEKNPLEAYRWWFRDFRIIKEKPLYEDVGEFFYVPSFKELLAAEQGLKLSEVDEFLERMGLLFVDYVLEA